MPLSLFQLFSLLSDDQLGSQAADSFSLLMSDSPDVLNRRCHANVRIMYRQRFFAENSAKLVQGFNCAEQGIYSRGVARYSKPSGTGTILISCAIIIIYFFSLSFSLAFFQRSDLYI